MSIQTSFTNKSLLPVTPATFGGLDFWLDATDTTTIQSSGNAVISWQNKGIRDFTATPSLGTPTTGTTWNGLNYVTCPSGSRLTFTSGFGSAGEQTWFIVARGVDDPPGTTGNIIFVENANNDRIYLTRNATTFNRGIFQLVLQSASRGNMVVSEDAALSNTSPATSNYKTDTRPGNPYGNVISYCAVNSDKFPITSNAITICGSEPIRLATNVPAGGSSGNPGGNRTADSVYTIGDTNNRVGWDFFEIIRYSRALTTTERQAVEGYIAWKYRMRTIDEQNFIPTSFSNCELWLDSGLFIDTSINFSGTTWLDKSGKGRHAVLGATSFGPSSNVYVGNGGVDAGFSTSAFLRCPLSISSDQPVTVFAVANQSTVTTSSRTIISINCTPGTRGNMLTLSTNPTTPRWIFGGGTTETNGYILSIPAVGGRADVVSAYWSPGSSQLFCRGVGGPPSSNTPTSLRAGSTTLIGATTTNVANSTTAGEFWRGEINEIIVYSRILSENQRKIVETYLANKWVNTLMTSTSPLHPFRHSMPYQRQFHPSDLVDYRIRFWIDATDPSTFTLSGTNLATIQDKSPEPRTLSIGGTVGYDTTTLNGIPSFNLSNGRITTNFTTAINASHRATAIFVGYLFNNPAVGHSAIATNSSSGNPGGARWRISEFNSSNTRNVWTNSTFVAQAIPAIAPAVSTGRPYVWASSMSDISGTSYRYSAYLNDGSGTNFNVNTQTGSNPNQFHLRVGGDVSIGLLSNTYPGCIGEVIIYDGYLTLSELRRVSGYLSWKWGFARSISSNWSYHASPSTSSINPVRPIPLSSIIMWYDAAEITAGQGRPPPAIGSTLSSWFDKSTHISPGLASIRTGTPMLTVTGAPTYELDGGKYPAVYFNGSSYMRSAEPGNIQGSTSFTIFVVGRTTSASAPRCRMFSHQRNDLTTSPVQVFYFDAQSTNGSMGVFYNQQSNYRYSANYAGSTRAGIHTIIQPAVDNNPIMFLNGNPVAIANSLGTTDGLSNTDRGYSTIGNGYNSVGSLSFNHLTGYVYEIIAYTTALSSNDREEVEGYLAWKWGIQDLLPSNHPFRQVTP
jgi:hypothetical protein